MVAPGDTRGPRGFRGARGPTNKLAVIGYLVMAIAVSVAFYFTAINNRKVDEARRERVRQLNQINHDQCASLKNLYAVIRKTILDSEMAIDTLAYYQAHPHERADAHQRNRETLKRFRSPPCPADITVP